MPRDKREFLTFPIDFDEHPVVAPLSDAAFRAFIEMNGYSRRLKLDGRIPAAVARKRWKSKTLSELVSSHPERPLILIDGDVYVIRAYSDHQFTTADAEELRAKRAAAGAKGGRQKASNVLANAEPFAKQNQAESRVKSQELRTIDISLPSQVSQEPNVRADRTEQTLDVLRIPELKRADRLGIKIAETRSWFEPILGYEIDMTVTMDMVEFILSKAARTVENVPGYLRSVVSKDPDSIREAAAMSIRSVA